MAFKIDVPFIETTDFIDITEIYTTAVSFIDTDAEGLLKNDAAIDGGLIGNESVVDTPPHQSPVYWYHYYMLYWTLSVHVFVFLFGGFNNSLFCFTFIRYKRLQTPFNAMSFALCMNDLVASVFAMPFSHALAQYQHWFHSLQTPLCNINACFLNFCKWNAVLIMVEMAVIRARMVFATRVWLIKKRTVTIIILCNILVSGSFSVYRSYLGTINICEENQNSEKGHLLMNSGVFLTLFTGLLLGYATLAIVTHRRAKEISRRDRGSNRYQIATIRSCAIIVIGYTLFHFPYITYAFLLYGGVVDDQTYYTHSFFVSFFAFVYVADSVILLATSSLYRKHIGMSLRSLTSESTPTPYPVVK